MIEAASQGGEIQLLNFVKLQHLLHISFVHSIFYYRQINL